MSTCRSPAPVECPD